MFSAVVGGARSDSRKIHPAECPVGLNCGPIVASLWAGKDWLRQLSANRMPTIAIVERAALELHGEAVAGTFGQAASKLLRQQPP